MTDDPPGQQAAGPPAADEPDSVLDGPSTVPVPGRTPDEPTPEDPWPDSPYPPLTITVPAQRRLPGWLAVVAGLTAVLAAVAFVVVLVWPSGQSGPGAPPPEPPAFGPRQALAEVDLNDAEAAFTQLVGDRAYIAWQDGDHLSVVALDLPGGTQVWRGQVSGEPDQHWVGLLAGPDVVVALGQLPEPADEAADEAADEPAGEPLLSVAVLSAVDGALRWDRTVHDSDELWLGDGTLVLVDRAGGVLRGLRLDTGGQRWGRPFPGGPGAEVAVVPVLTTTDLAGPSSLGGQPAAGPYQQLVMVGEDYSARLLDTADGTGQLATNVASPRDLLVAYEDRLFVAYDYPGYRVDERDLSDLAGQPRSVYVTPDPRRRPVALSRCGPDRLCLLDRAGEPETAQVRAIDLAAARDPDPQRWVQDAPHAQWLLSAGGALVVGGWQAPLAGYDRAGEPVLRQPDGAAVRLDDGRVLVFSTGPGTWSQDLSLAGLAVATGDRTELGQLPQVYGAGCSWGGPYLACPGETAATVWRLTPTEQ